MDGRKVKDFLEYGIKLSLEIERAVKISVDVKILNSAPLSFKYRVLREPSAQ